MEHLSSRSICSAVRLMELLSTKCIASKRGVLLLLLLHVQREIEGAGAAGEEHMKDLSSPTQALVAQRSDKA